MTLTRPSRLYTLLQCLFLTLSLLSNSIAAVHNPYATLNGAELRLAIAKLQVLGSVLYIGAHPDDENTALIAFLAKDRLYDTAYLSLTRGDGGQNLLGSEKSEQLGLIRTQELLAARRIDGGRQFFTRAIDFGFSKSADETLAIWNRRQVLSDMVWIIRRFQPDVIMSRFPANGDGGHGHHTASAILAKEAFLAAADPQQFSEQLTQVAPWQAKRLLWNGWRLEANQAAQAITLDIGGFNPLLGKSYTEIAGESRSMHKSQGFGSAERRGTRLEYFVVQAGEPATRDIYENINSDWSRVPGGSECNEKINKILQNFDEARPEKSLPALLDLEQAISKLPANRWSEQKLKDLHQIIRMAAGLWLDAVSDDFRAVAGKSLNLTASAVLRSTTAVKLCAVRMPFRQQDSTLQITLKPQEPLEIKSRIDVPGSESISQPYWLTQPPDKGTYRLDGADRIGEPEPFAPMQALFTLGFGDRTITLAVPLSYRWTDPVEGENYRDVLITPPITATLDRSLYVFNDEQSKTVRVRVHNHAEKSQGNIMLQLPDGWKATPNSQPFVLDGKDAEQELTFTLLPSSAAVTGQLEVKLKTDTGTWDRDMGTIRYPHIPTQTWFPSCSSRLVRLPRIHADRKIGYVMGSGDDIPELLQQLGYPVTLLTDQDLTDSNLDAFQVIITGVRAYNTRPVLKQAYDKLMAFVKQGGIMIVQYNTNSRLATERIGPYPFRISRDRVTVEEAPVQVLLADDPLLNKPYKIQREDFDGWVQERGLYFADQWDGQYRALLSCNDPGEKERLGGMLVTRYGKGVFMFSAYAWFRQLPAGNPGAFKLFLNMVQAR
jgi:LmbE family N-acetylglucosaminyl deacetylase